MVTWDATLSHLANPREMLYFITSQTLFQCFLLLNKRELIIFVCPWNQGKSRERERERFCKKRGREVYYVTKLKNWWFSRSIWKWWVPRDQLSSFFSSHLCSSPLHLLVCLLYTFYFPQFLFLLVFSQVYTLSISLKFTVIWKSKGCFFMSYSCKCAFEHKIS